MGLERAKRDFALVLIVSAAIRSKTHPASRIRHLRLVCHKKAGITAGNASIAWCDQVVVCMPWIK